VRDVLPSLQLQLSRSRYSRWARSRGPPITRVSLSFLSREAIAIHSGLRTVNCGSMANSSSMIDSHVWKLLIE